MNKRQISTVLVELVKTAKPSDTASAFGYVNGESEIKGGESNPQGYLIDATPEAFESPESSTIKEAMYYPASKLLIVVFRETGPYSFQGVEMKLWAQFKLAESKGVFLAEHITGRKGNQGKLFQSRKLA